MPDADFERFLSELRRSKPWLPEALAHHYARLYGTRTAQVIGAAQDIKALGQHFGELLYQCEIDYLRKEEWAATAQDILDRRTKHGLHLSAGERDAVRRYMGA